MAPQGTPAAKPPTCAAIFDSGENAVKAKSMAPAARARGGVDAAFRWARRRAAAPLAMPRRPKMPPEAPDGDVGFGPGQGHGEAGDGR